MIIHKNAIKNTVSINRIVYIGDISIKEKYNLPKCEQERKEKNPC